MKISELLKSDGPTLSYEVFPPKTESVYDATWSRVAAIGALQPSFMSVTYGAGGGEGDYTLKIAGELKIRRDMTVMAHLTCISSTKHTVEQRIKALSDAGIVNIMALRGDIPQGQSVDAERDYHHATELITELKAAGDFCIGAACYPEIHPESVSRADDIKYTKAKVDAGAEFLVSQLFFANEIFLDYVEELQSYGVTVPVVPGIMPVTSRKQLERMTAFSTCYIPAELRRYVDSFGDDEGAMTAAGIDYAVEQIMDLYAHGVGHVHVYAMNNPAVCREISRRLSGILACPC